MPTSTDAKNNRLLAALPDAEWQRWLPQLEAVDLTLGQVLYQSGSPPTHAHFPTTAIVSLLHVTGEGASAGIAVVGNEGIVGAALLMGGTSTLGRAVVQSAGRAYRMDAQRLTDEFDRSARVRQLLLRYTQALMTQTAQTAVCNRHHSLDQQLCRWLLLCLDRLAGIDLAMTQELIAQNLGVRREGVTEGALELQRLGLIRYWRGHIRVLDRRGLESRACECYAAVRTEYERLLPEAAIANASAAEHVRQPAPAALTPHAVDFGDPSLQLDRRIAELVGAPWPAAASPAISTTV